MRNATVGTEQALRCKRCPPTHRYKTERRGQHTSVATPLAPEDFGDDEHQAFSDGQCLRSVKPRWRDLLRVIGTRTSIGTLARDEPTGGPSCTARPQRKYVPGTKAGRRPTRRSKQHLHGIGCFRCTHPTPRQHNNTPSPLLPPTTSRTCSCPYPSCTTAA